MKPRLCLSRKMDGHIARRPVARLFGALMPKGDRELRGVREELESGGG